MKKTINEFIPRGGQHCITTSLKQLFEFYQCPLSEEMIFGIGEGLDFTYINMATSPLVSGRSKVIEFETVLASRLGIQLRIKKSQNNEKVAEYTKEQILANNPVLVYADMPFLPYLKMPANSHFGGHTVVLFGYDDQAEVFYVSDRDNHDYPIRTPAGICQADFHLVGYDEMAQARGSNYRPFPANNKLVQLDFSTYSGVTKEVIKTALINNSEKMLKPPARLKGITGIQKMGQELKKWQHFDDKKLKQAGLTNYFQINGDGGTGGGIFRKMYGNFLIESSSLLNNDNIKEIGEGFVILADEWDNVAKRLWELSQTGHRELLIPMSTCVLDLYEKEKELLERMQRVAFDSL